MNWWAFSLNTGIPPGSPESSEVYDNQLKKIEAAGFNFSRCSQIESFPMFGVLAALLPQDFGVKLGDILDAASVVKPTPIPRSPTGRWYINLLAAWEHVIRESEHFAGACVNVSLNPPESDGNVFDPEEPFNRATKAAYLRGVVPVLAAGNGGESGDETMTRWASADWVISVGATDETGQRIRSYSSRGSPENAGIRPTCVAYDGVFPFGREGTSFAAQQVTDAVFLLISFFVGLWLAAKQPLAPLISLFPSVVRRSLIRIARPVAANPHECGAGYMTPQIARDYLTSLDLGTLAAIVAPVLTITVTAPSDWTKYLAIAKNALGQRRLDTLLDGHPPARFTIDTMAEWSRPTFVPGLLRLSSYFLLREGDEFRYTQSFDAARFSQNHAVYEQIAILPRAQLGRILNVGAGQQFPTIQAAVVAGERWDVVQIAPGVYTETVTLKSGVALRGTDGTVLRPKNGMAVIIDGVVDVTIANMEILAEAKNSDTVQIHNSADIVIEKCRIASSKCNALGVYNSRRCIVRDSQLTGALNGSCVILCSEWTLERSEVTGHQAGLVVYGKGGKLRSSQVNAKQGDGLVWVLEPIRWTKWDPTTVHTYPSGSVKIPAAEVGPHAIHRQDFVGWLSAKFYTIAIEDSTVRGLRNGVATTAPSHLVQNRSTMSSIESIRLVHRKPIRMDRPDISKLQRLVENNLRAAIYGADGPVVADIGTGTRSVLEKKAMLGLVWENILVSSRMDGKSYAAALLRYYRFKFRNLGLFRPQRVSIRLR